jgi:hypothetical protein
VALLAIVVPATSGHHRTGDCVVGLDLTVGKDQPKIAREYVDWAGKALERCAADGATRFTVFPITNSTASDAPSLPPVQRRFALATDKNVKNQRNAITRWIDHEAHGRIAELAAAGRSDEPGTDLLAAPDVATGYFDDRGRYDFRQLILVTDGFHNLHGGVDMTRNRLGDGERRTLLDQLATSGQVPRLAGIDVEMCGIAGGPHSERIPRAQQTHVRSFWHEFFGRAQTRLGAYEASCDG